MSTNLFGGIQVSDSTQFDSHLLLLFIPAIFLIGIFLVRNQVRATSLSVRKKLSILSGSILLASFFLVFATFFVEKNYAADFASSFGFIHSLDLLATFVIASLLILRMPGVAKQFAPLAIVFALTKIINNPGQNISYFELSNAILLIIVPFFALFLSRESVPLSVHALTSVISAGLLVYIFVVNTIGGTNFSMINYDALSRNVFYQYFADAKAQIFIFAIMTALSQTIVWLIIRYEHHTHYYYNSHLSWVKVLFIEFKTKSFYRVILSNIAKKFKFEFELEPAQKPLAIDLAINELEDEIAGSSSDKLIDTETKEASYEMDFEIVPVATFRTITLVGPRAPTWQA